MIEHHFCNLGRSQGIDKRASEFENELYKARPEMANPSVRQLADELGVTCATCGFKQPTDIAVGTARA